MPELRSVAFTSGDGVTQVPSYLAVPDGAGPHPTVLILRGVAGPDDGYTEIAERFAGWGYAALMHGWKIRGNDPPDDLVYADMQGAIAYLHSVREADITRFAVFGFCRGGVHAFMAARAHDEVRAIVVFHGFAFRSPRAQPGAQPYDLVEAVNVPTLIMHGTEDEQAPLETMQRLETRMRTLGKACAFTYYAGARHGFAVRTHPGFEAMAATRSFEEARRFLDTHLRETETARPSRDGGLVMARIPIAPPGMKDQRPRYTLGWRVGNTIYVAGQLPYDKDGNLVGKGDIKAQTRRIFEQIKMIVEAGGGKMDDVVKVTVFVTDVRYREAYGEVRSEFFGANPPASTLVQISNLAIPDALIEIEAVAALES